MLRDCDISTANLLHSVQTRRRGRTVRQQVDVVLCWVKVFHPVSGRQEFGCLDELGDRVGGHQTEDVALDALVHGDSPLKLGRVEVCRMLWFSASLPGFSRMILQLLFHMLDKLIALSVVDIELTLTSWSEVGVVDDEGGVHEGFVVAFHGGLTRGVARTRSGSRWSNGLGAGRDVKLALQILNVKPEGQVLLAEVTAQELAEERTKTGLFENVAKAVSVALLDVLLLCVPVTAVHLLRHRDATVKLGVFARGVIAMNRGAVIAKIGRRRVGRGAHGGIPGCHALTFLSDLVDGLCCATELADLLLVGALIRTKIKMNATEGHVR